MYCRFEQRGYRKETLDNALTKVKTFNRNTLLNRRSEVEQQPHKIFCSIQSGNMAYNIKDIINKNWDILLSDASL